MCAFSVVSGGVAPRFNSRDLNQRRALDDLREGVQFRTSNAVAAQIRLTCIKEDSDESKSEEGETDLLTSSEGCVSRQSQKISDLEEYSDLNQMNEEVVEPQESVQRAQPVSKHRKKGIARFFSSSSESRKVNPYGFSPTNFKVERAQEFIDRSSAAEEKKGCLEFFRKSLGFTDSEKKQKLTKVMPLNVARPFTGVTF